MKHVCLVDTSVLCEILQVPGKSSHATSMAVLEQLSAFSDAGAELYTLFLPLAAIFETGNHIAKATCDGQTRRKAAERFVRQIREAIEGAGAWEITPFASTQAMVAYLTAVLQQFPDHAMRGIGWGDVSIIYEFQRQCQLNPSSHVFIWSLDADLQGYDYTPSGMSSLW